MTIKAEFVTGHKGKYFLTQWPSKQKNAPVLVILQPFAEEQNKVRHLYRKLAEPLQQQGWQILLPDHYGTGDSEGDLDTATTVIWRNDLQQLLASLANDGFKQVNFLAVRFGALQLFDLLNHSNLALKPQQLILWQPVFDIDKFWQQFVRIKVAEAMAVGAKISEKELQQLLANGQSIEIAGYPVSPDFYRSLAQMNSALPERLPEYSVSWFETSQLNTTALPVKNMLQQLQQVDVNFVPIKDELYWQSTDLASADTLIALTLQQLTSGTA